MMTRVTTLVMMASSSAKAALLMISALVQLTASPSSSAVTSALMTDMERRDVQHKGRLRKIDEPAHLRGHGQVREMA